MNLNFYFVEINKVGLPFALNESIKEDECILNYMQEWMLMI